MAKAFELKTMNVLAAHGEDRRDRVDGEDDVARLDHDEHREQRRGQPLAVDPREQRLAVVLARGRHDLAARPCSTGLFSGWISSSSWRSSRIAVKIRNPPKTKSIHSNRLISATPAKMKMKRSTSAPNTPQNSTRNWYARGHGEVAHDDRPHEDVVDRQALLDQVAGDVLTGRLAAPHAPDDERERRRRSRSRPRSRWPLPWC